MIAIRTCTCLLALASATLSAQAQTLPDAGRLLQQDRAAPTPPRPSQGLTITPPAPDAALPGGQTVALVAVRFEGHTVFTSEQLSGVLGQVLGQRYDLAGLQALAQRVSAYYRGQGYPFARAYLPAQALTDGQLTIAIVEGRYGQIRAMGDARLAAAAQGFLDALQPGAVIDAASLERATLILADQPGLAAAPIMRPGQSVGTGDLVVQVSSERRWSGEVGLDNQGNRYTGEYRARLNLQFDSPFLFGDQFTLRSSYSDAGQWLGQLGYSLPLGTSGLRGQISHAHTYYELGQQFADLDATGTADITSVGITYPWLRSQRANVTVGASYQYKMLKDQQGAANLHNDKQSQSLPLSVQFDVRDGLGGGGLSYGSLSYANGRLHLDAALQASDAVTAHSRGSFDKWNLDLARVQATALPNLSLYGRVSAQWAGKNLDSSEDFGVGGVSGVRAYPGGEGFGDEGWLTQLEARYAVGPAVPYVFYDVGGVNVNRHPWADGDRGRTLSGAGIGVRASQGSWSVDVSMAWRDRGGAPQSDTVDRLPRVWASIGLRF